MRVQREVLMLQWKPLSQGPLMPAVRLTVTITTMNTGKVIPADMVAATTDNLEQEASVV